eukprot:169906_1
MDNTVNNRIVIAQWDYIAQEDDELSFSKGDKIVVLDDEDDAGWCEGRLETNNNKGWFNMLYINTDPSNVNHICFCRKPLRKYAEDWAGYCKCCCKKYESKDIWYECFADCKYKKISTSDYMTCAKCYQTQPDISTDENENEHAFMKRKIEETLNIIKKEIKQCKDNDQTRQYLVMIALLTLCLRNLFLIICVFWLPLSTF